MFLVISIAATCGIAVGFLLSQAASRVVKTAKIRDTIELIAQVTQSVSILFAVVALVFQYQESRKHWNVETFSFLTRIETNDVVQGFRDLKTMAQSAGSELAAAIQHPGEEEAMASFKENSEFMLDYPDFMKKHRHSIYGYINSVDLCIEEKICDKKTVGMLACQEISVLHYVEKLYSDAEGFYQVGADAIDCSNQECIPTSLKRLVGLCDHIDIERDLLLRFRVDRQS